MKNHWTREEWIRIFEILIENGCYVISSKKFRDLLSRDENLLANQFIREANGNIAYKQVDFDIHDLSDEEFWEKIDSSCYNGLIEDNAVVALYKNLGKNGIIEE